MLALASSTTVSPAERFALDVLRDLAGVLPCDGREDVVQLELMESRSASDVGTLRSRQWSLVTVDGVVRMERSLLAMVVEIAGAAAEQRSVARDRFGRVPAAENPLVAARLEREPVVSDAAVTLGDAVRRAAGRRVVAFTAPWPNGRRWAAALTHDLDVVAGWPVFTALRLLELVRKGHVANAAQVLLAAMRSAAGDPVRRALDLLLEAEASNSVRSSWFVLCGSPTLHTMRAGDLTYDADSPAVRNILDALAAATHEVGLHGSFATMIEGARFASQRAHLARLTAAPVAGVRQHFLRMRPGATQCAMRDAGFSYDATYGFADRNGFRLGVADVVPAWDVASGRATSLSLAPFMWMDRALSKYRGNEDPFDWVSDALELAARCRSVGGIWAGIWHPNLSPALGYPRAPEAYALLLRELTAMEPHIAPLGELVAWRSARRAVRCVGIDPDGTVVCAPCGDTPHAIVVEDGNGRPLEIRADR